jgi:hypothetical protein
MLARIVPSFSRKSHKALLWKKRNILYLNKLALIGIAVILSTCLVTGNAYAKAYTIKLSEELTLDSGDKPKDKKSDKKDTKSKKDSKKDTKKKEVKKKPVKAKKAKAMKTKHDTVKNSISNIR